MVRGLWKVLWLVALSLAACHASATVHFIHTDHLGTPQKITDVKQQTVWAASFSAFGTATLSVSVVENNLRFPGQYFDQETGNHYNYFRDYDPSIGRYLQSDPIGLRGGNNTYTYVASNPLRYLDPTGLEVKWTGGTVGGGVTAGIGSQVLFFEFTSECKCNKSVRVRGFASFLTIGSSVRLPFVGDVSGSGGSQTLVSPNSDCPDASDFNGFASMGGVNVVLPFGGGSLFPHLYLGSTRSEPSVFAGPAFGGDIGVTYAIVGRSAVTASESTSGCCD